VDDTQGHASTHCMNDIMNQRVSRGRNQASPGSEIHKEKVRHSRYPLLPPSVSYQMITEALNPPKSTTGSLSKTSTCRGCTETTEYHNGVTEPKQQSQHLRAIIMARITDLKIFKRDIRSHQRPIHCGALKKLKRGPLNKDSSSQAPAK
jgi:hypothetical protein